MRKKLTKSRTNIVFSGVLGGIAEYLGIDATVLRIIFVALTFFTAFFPGFTLYFILLFLIPSGRKSEYKYYSNYGGYDQSKNKESKRKEAEKIDDDDDDDWSDF